MTQEYIDDMEGTMGGSTRDEWQSSAKFEFSEGLLGESR